MVRTYQGDLRAIAAGTLDRAAFALLLLLATFFAFEQTQGVIQGELLVLTNVELLLAGTLFLWVISRLLSGESPRLPRSLVLPCLAWFGWLVLSLALAPAHQDKALLFMARLLAGLALCLVTYDLANTTGRRYKVIMAMVSGTVIVAGLGLAEASGLAPVVNWLDAFKIAPTRVGDVLRISSTLSYATITAMVLELTLPLLLVIAISRKKVAGTALAGLATFLLLLAHVLTLSRAGVLAILASLGFFILAGLRRRNRRLVGAGLVTALTLLLLVVIVLTVNPTARLRLTTETEQGWYQATYQAPETLYARPGQQIITSMQLTNAGARNWTSSGRLPFALSYHLNDANGQVVTYDGARSTLPVSVAPGERIELPAVIVAPQEPGHYRIEWDMVQEEVTWFSWKDASTSSTSLVVSGVPLEKPTLSVSKPPADVRLLNPTPGRLELWQEAWRMFLDRPVFGVGPDNFRWAYGAYAGLAAWDSGIHANNLYIEWLADTGLPGLLIFLWFSWRLARLAMKRLDSAQDDPRSMEKPEKEEVWLLSVGIAASLVAWYIHGFFDYFFEFTPTYVAFWLLVALLVRSPGRRSNGVANRV